MPLAKKQEISIDSLLTIGVRDEEGRGRGGGEEGVIKY